MLTNKKENKLCKGTGYHLDITVVSIFGLINGFLGLPFLMGGSLRAAAHVDALTVYTKSQAREGQYHLQFKRIREQRVTSFFCNVLVGESRFLLIDITRCT